MVLWLGAGIERGGVCWTIRQLRCSWHFLTVGPTVCLVGHDWVGKIKSIVATDSFIQPISFNQLCDVLTNSTLPSLRPYMVEATIL